MKGKELQIRYSKDRLCQAFLELLKEDAYEEIPVSEILDRAQISRRTFYRHFTNKGALLDYHLDQLLTEYAQEEEKMLQARTFDQMLAVTLSFWYQKRDSLRLLIRNGQYDRFVEKINQQAPLLYRAMDAPWHLTEQMSPQSLDHVLQFIVGGYSNILRSWLLEKDPHSPQQIAKDIRALFAIIHQNFPEDET